LREITRAVVRAEPIGIFAHDSVTISSLLIIKKPKLIVVAATQMITIWRSLKVFTIPPGLDCLRTSPVR